FSFADGLSEMASLPPRPRRRALGGELRGLPEEAGVAGEAVVGGAAVTGGPVDAVVVEDVDLLAVGRDLGRVRRAADLIEVAGLQRRVLGRVHRVAVGVDVDLGPGRLR